MLADSIGLLLTILALISLALQRFYSCVPAKELKRLAARGERLALSLYRPVAYGTSLRVLLWLIAGISMPVGFLLLVQNMPVWLSLPIMMIALAASAIWLPNLQLSWQSAKLAGWAAPVLDWVLQYCHGFFDALADLVNNHRTLSTHSGLYEKEDMHALLSQQQAQEDNRIDPSEVQLMQRALNFSDTKAVEVAVPRKKARLLETSDALGPVLFDELHKTGQQFFVVYRGKPDNIVGILSVGEANHSRKGGTVADLMHTELCFVGEDFTLPQLAQAFVKTGQQVAIVINKFEEFVGIITFGALMDFLFAAQISQAPVAQYDDRAAVAGYGTAPADIKATPADEESTPSPEVPEVVE